MTYLFRMAIFAAVHSFASILRVFTKCLTSAYCPALKRVSIGDLVSKASNREAGDMLCRHLLKPLRLIAGMALTDG